MFGGQVSLVTRPDISYGVNLLSQYPSSSRDTRWQAAIRVMRYIKFTPDHGMLLSYDSTIYDYMHLISPALNW